MATYAGKMVSIELDGMPLASRIANLRTAATDWGNAMRTASEAFIRFAVVVNHPNVSGKKRAFLIRQARRNIRAKRA